MRTRKIATWVCGAVLCCAVPAVFCQTLSGSLAAGTGLSAEAPQGGSGMGSIGASSQVSASASSAMNADAKTSVNAEAATGAEANGGGNSAGVGGARLDFQIGLANSARDLNKPVNGRLELGLEHGLAGRRTQESKEKKEVTGHAAIRLTRRNTENGTVQAEQSRSGQVWRTREDSARKFAPTTLQSGATYSKDFPDSTKGTALVSPPDSTTSPFDWAAGMNFGFPDLAKQPFLEPSLHSGYSLRKGRVTARTKAPATGGIPSDAVTSPDLSNSLGDPLRVSVSDPLADLQLH